MGANVWNPLTPRPSHTTAEPERAGVTAGDSGFLSGSAKRGHHGAGEPGQQEAKPSFRACEALPPPQHCPQEFPEALPLP